ncbi:GntR family transcriptional regulator [Slackia exigua]|uniref:GntR family transcriptional regulator n=1 Tax=Slackia exigua TaxID=84109 RepID=UPI00254B6186|nr:GntR family transcriptional regulator [Slackia exigua]MDK7723629.1 GntR family transcriptional regulator [Slackia exigua]MDK7725795.1 GntR family transcriptional regulator [Slackia exigua]
MAAATPKTFSFSMDESSDIPLWAQLRNRIVYLINSGYYVPGEQLPTVRALASDISINYNTVNKAYLALKSDGYVESTRGRGAFVRASAADADDSLSHEADAVMQDCINACRAMGMSLDDIQLRMIRTVRQFKQEEGRGRNV